MDGRGDAYLQGLGEEELALQIKKHEVAEEALKQKCEQILENLERRRETREEINKGCMK